jgi:hypothetical protein
MFRMFYDPPSTFRCIASGVASGQQKFAETTTPKRVINIRSVPPFAIKSEDESTVLRDLGAAYKSRCDDDIRRATDLVRTATSKIRTVW